MSLSDLEMIFIFIGGLGMFLYGMNVMSEGIQKTAGNKLKGLMSTLTKNRFFAVLWGALITVIIQSSTATTVMVVGFVNAGLMNLTQAVGIIMGANIGTTLTSWLVSLNEWGSLLSPNFFAPLIIGTGAFIALFSKSEKKKNIAHMLVGFGILFIGLNFMSDAIRPYRDAEIFKTIFAVLGQNPLLGVLAGFVVTGIIQSSTASVGILQTLAANGIVNWQSAVFITLGQNLGSCITAVISSVGTNRMAKRAAYIHLIFNIIGVVLFTVIMYVLFRIYPDWSNSTISSLQISIFHTVFNIAMTVVLFPFANQLVKLSGLLIREKPGEEDEEEDLIKIKIDERMFETPALAIEAINNEVARMGDLVYKNTMLAVKALGEDDENSVEKVFKNEKLINQYGKSLLEYLVRIDTLSLTASQYEELKDLIRIIGELERIGDHCENLAELSQERTVKGLNFSDVAAADFKIIAEMVLNSLKYGLSAVKSGRIKDAKEAVQYENKVDELERVLREKHIDRVSRAECSIESSIIFFDALTNLQWISDHAYNIAGVLYEGQRLSDNSRTL